MMQEEFQPRENDHLVEPMYAGLGVGEEGETTEPAVEHVEEPRKTEDAPSFLVILSRFFRRLFG